jgi:hypothetical protein
MAQVSFNTTARLVDELAAVGLDRVYAEKVLKAHLIGCLREMKEATETSVLFMEQEGV